jgi:hypothetical protein
MVKRTRPLSSKRDQIAAIAALELDNYFTTKKDEVYLNFKQEVLNNPIKWCISEDKRDCGKSYEEISPEVHEVMIAVFRQDAPLDVKYLIDFLDMDAFVHEKTYINQSATHGMGLFAKEDIPAKTTMHSITIQWGLWNHAAKPNDNCIAIKSKGVNEERVWSLLTIRDIEKDEELLIDFEHSGPNFPFW